MSEADVHQADQLAEREQDAEALRADGGRHRRKDAHWREHHDVVGEAEHDLRGALEHIQHRLALGADRRHRNTEEGREYDHLQDVAARHGVDDRGREQVQEDVPPVLLALHEAGGGRRVRANRQRHARAGLEDVDEDEAEEQGDRRRDFEVDDRLQSDAAHRLQIAGPGDADDQRGEHERRDDHLDHAQERVGQRLHADAERWPEIADGNPEHQPGDDLRGDAAALRRRPGGLEIAASHTAAPDVRRTNSPMVSTTCCCCPALSSPYTGIARVSSAARSACGKSPRVWPRYAKQGCRWNGTG